MGEHDAAVVQGDLEGDAAAAAGAAGEHGAVVGQQAGRIAVLGGDAAVAGLDVGAFEHGAGGAGQQQPGVVVEPVQDLHVGAVGQRPVGDVGLPAFVGLLGGEAEVAALRAFVRLRGDEPAGGQDPPDRRDRRGVPMPHLKVSRDRRRAGLVPVLVEVLADRDDLVLQHGPSLRRAGQRTTWPWNQPGIALGQVTAGPA